MKKMQLIQYTLMGLCMLLYSCPWDDGGNSTKQDLTEPPIKADTFSPIMIITDVFVAQGDIRYGNISITSGGTNKQTHLPEIKQLFIQHRTSGFIIKSVDGFSEIHKSDGIYIRENAGKHFLGATPNNDHLSDILHTYQLTPSSDFQGTMHIFLNFTSLYRCGLPDGSCDVRRVVIYDKELAEELKNTHKITHMGKNNTHLVGAREPVVIDHTAEPEGVRALMKAAITTGDPRLLVIERTGSTGKVSITAFGEEKKIDAGKTYEWKFGEAQLNALRKFVVKR